MYIKLMSNYYIPITLRRTKLKESNPQLPKKPQSTLNNSVIRTNETFHHSKINSTTIHQSISLPKLEQQNEIQSNTTSSVSSKLESFQFSVESRKALQKITMKQPSPNKRRQAVGSLSQISQVYEYKSKQFTNSNSFKDYHYLKDPSNIFMLSDLEKPDKKLIDLSYSNSGSPKKSQQARKNSIFFLDEISINHSPTAKFTYQNQDKIIGQLNSIIKHVQNGNIEEIENLFKSVGQDLRNVGIGNLYLLFVFIFAETLEIFGNWSQAANLWKKHINFCNAYQIFKYKIIGYKYLSSLSVKLRQYGKALVYSKKLLKLSWLLNEKNYEIECYEQAALISYYNNDINLAKQLHNKYMDGYFEKKDSKLRILAESVCQYSLQNKKINIATDSEDDFDMNSLIQEKQDDYISYDKIEKEIISKKQELTKILLFHSKKNQNFPIQKINSYVAKVKRPLGPIIKSQSIFQSDEESTFSKSRGQQKILNQAYYHQMSNNRELNQSIIARETLNKYHRESSFMYFPYASIKKLVQMIDFFIQDIAFYYQNGKFQ